ncbi:MAG: HNH endonuclease [Vicinamibacteria bacterium]
MDAREAARQDDDRALAARAQALAARAREAVAALAACVDAIEARDLHLAHGHSSLFAYCRDALALSEHDAYCVVAAARASRRFPAVLGLLADGGLTLTTAKLLAPHLTPANVDRVLRAARGKRRAQVEEIVAGLVPPQEAPPELRRLTAPVVRPTAADRFRLQVTIGAAAVEKLRCAQDLLRHVDPRGDEAAVVERALAALVSELARRKFAATAQPHASAAPADGSRHVPADVKRAVFVRDLGRCAFVAASGRRCDTRGFLEFHHVRPFADGGGATIGNIQLRCRRHNDYETRAHLGPGTPPLL